MAPRTYEIGGDGAIDFVGRRSLPAFLLIHGFATSPLDLLPLAEALSSRGYRCRLPVLRGHGPMGSLEDVKPRDWAEDVAGECSRLADSHPSTYVVGFSLGATLALSLGDELPADAIIGLSTFIEPPQRVLARLILRFARAWKAGLPRLVQTTKRETRRFLYYKKTFPPSPAALALETGRDVALGSARNIPPTLLIHSINDRVASYAAVARFAVANPNVCVVSVAGLNHFLQFDVSPAAVADLILTFVGRKLPGDPVSRRVLAERMEQRDTDARYWSEIIFRLIVASFTIFGALLFFSLEDVFNETERAPAFLMAYVTIISFYVLLASLYFFYLVRVDVYSRTMLDPLDQPFGWTLFRTTPHVSGAASARMTRLTSIAVVALPLLVAPTIWGYAVARYWADDFGPSADNSFHQVIGVVALGLWLMALSSAATLGSYASQHLYGRMPVTCYSRLRTALDRFLLAIEPASVRPSFDRDFYVAEVKQHHGKAQQVPPDVTGPGG